MSRSRGLWTVGRTCKTALLSLLLLLLAGCSDELQPPVAVIDAPASAFVGDVVALDGSNSYDPGGATLAYEWSFLRIPGGSQADLNNPALFNPSFTADVAGTYTVILVVDNGEVPSVAVSADIEVLACGGQRPLVASIAADPATPGVGETVRLTADVTDPDNEEGCGLNQALRYYWTMRAKPTGSHTDFNDPRLPSPTVTVDVSGEYAFQLVVTDSTDLSSEVAEFTLTVTVCGEANPVVESIAADPLAPMAGQPVRLAAQISDADNADGCALGQTFTYQWELVDQPTGGLGRLMGVTLPSPFLITDLPGSYFVELVVTDSTGRASQPAQLEIVANACGTRAPVVDEIVATPAAPNTGDLVVLAVTVSDEDNGTACVMEQALTVHSEFVGRPAGSQAVFAPAEGLGPAFVADLPGDYAIRVTVTDGSGLSGFADLEVTVSTCGNNPPVATLSYDPSSPIVGQAVYLTAEVTDADLWDSTETDTCRLTDSFTYEWVILSAPEGSLASILLPYAPNSGFVPDLVGTYLVECRIFDAAGHRNVVLGEAGNLALEIAVGPDASPEVSVGAFVGSTALGSTTEVQRLTPLTVSFTCESGEGEPPFAYAWSFGNGVTSHEQNPTYTYTMGGSYLATCVVTDSNGDIGQDSVLVPVVQDTSPRVMVSATPLVGFADLEVTFSSSVHQGNGTLSYLWDFGDDEGSSTDPNPSYTYYRPGSFLVSLTVTDEDGDVGSASLTIAVGTDSKPAVMASARPLAGVSETEIGLRVELLADIVGGDHPLVISWDFEDDGTTDSAAQNPIHFYVYEGAEVGTTFTAVVTVTDADGDVAESSVEVYVEADTAPAAANIDVDADYDMVLNLTPLTVAFSCDSTATNEPLSYHWDFGDGGVSNLQNPSYTYPNPGEYIATCTVTDSDGDSGSNSVDMDSQNPGIDPIVVLLDTAPQVSIVASTLSGVTPLAVDFEPIVTGGNFSYTYAWQIEGSDFTSETASHVFETAGVYRVVLSVTDADGDIGTDSVEVEVLADSEPVVVARVVPNEGLSPLPVQFFADVVGGDQPLTFVWDYDIETGGTADSDAQNPVFAEGYLCDIVDGDPFEPCVFTAQVTVTDHDLDMDDATVQTTVWPDIAPEVTASADVAGGLTPLTVQFECEVSATRPGNGAVSYLWEFGDGGVSTLQNPVYTYQTAFVGSAVCTVTDADGDTGDDGVYLVVELDSQPMVAIQASTLAGVAKLTVELTAVVTGGDEPFVYAWTANGSVAGGAVDSDKVTYSFAQPGVYPVVVTVTDSDGDIATDTVQVAVGSDSHPIVAARAVPNAGLSPLGVQLFADVGGGDAPFIFSWTLQGTVTPNTSNAQNPVVTYVCNQPDAGQETCSYLAEVLVEDNDGDTDEASVVVTLWPDLTPVVTAAANPATGRAPLMVEFTCGVTNTNAASEPLSYLWEFGDGGFSTLQSPVYTYQAGFTGSAYCTVTDANGDSATDGVYLDVDPDLQPMVAIEASTLAGVAKLTVELTAVVTGGDAPFVYSWTANGSVAGGAVDSDQVTYSFAQAGVYPVVVTVTDNDGDTATDTVSVAVGTDSQPNVVARSTPRSGLTPLEVQLFADVGGGDAPFTYLWDFGGTVVGNPSADVQNPVVTYTCGTPNMPDGSCAYTASVAVTDSDEDPANASVTVTIWPDLEVNAVASASKTSGFTPLMVQFECGVTGTDPGNEPLSYLWDFGDGGTSTLANPVYTFQHAGVFTPTCTVTDADGDDDSAPAPAITVTADSLPTVTIQASTLSGVASLSVDFTAVVSGGNAPFEYTWLANGNTSHGETANRIFDSAGVYPVFVTVTDDDDDTDTATVQVTVSADSFPAVAAWGTPADGASPLTVQFTSQVAGGNGAISYLWDFDGLGTSIFTAPVFVYEYTGSGASTTHTATLTVKDEDGDPAQALVVTTVYRDYDVVAAATAIGTLGVAPYLVEFDCATVGTDTGNKPLSYFWTFGDGGTSTMKDPVHIYQVAGLYTATCTITDTDGDESDPAPTAEIVVLADTAPVVAIEASPRSGGAPLTVDFSALVMGGNEPLSYQWSFGSTAASTSYTFQTVDEFLVLLVVTDEDGDTGSDQVIITTSACGFNEDCQEITGGACDPVTGVCLPPSCEDGILNNEETDLDCGGPNCDPCPHGALCVEDGDCCGNSCEEVPIYTDGSTVTGEAAIGVISPTEWRCVGPWLVDDDSEADTSDPDFGLTWEAAYPDLQWALSWVDAGSGQQIWVADGTYLAGTYPTDTFALNGVELYGGFMGTEQYLWEREESTGVSTLSGYFDTGNVHHVVTVESDNVLIDGFIIENGSASGGVGGGLYASGLSGDLLNGLTIQNTKFRYNNADYGGGAVYLDYVQDVDIVNCIFYSNNALLAVASGGGVYISNASSTLIRNSIFYNNTSSATDSYHVYTEPLTATPLFVNNIFGTGSLLVPVGSVHYSLVVNWAIPASNEGYAYEYCETAADCWAGGGVTCDLLGAGPEKVCSASTNIAGPPLFQSENAPNYDFHFLDDTAPGIDEGVGVYNEFDFCPANDMDGISRPQGSYCDMGAYEYPAYVVGFEFADCEGSSDYSPRTVDLNGIQWALDKVMIINDSNDWKIGDRSARLRGHAGTYMTMVEPQENGLGILTFLYRRYQTDDQVEWVVEYSVDGVDWIQVGEKFTAPESDDVQTFQETVNVGGDILVRIRTTATTGTVNKRLNIDDIRMSDYYE